MKQALVLAAFLLTTLVFAIAQQPDTSSGASPSSQSSQTPGASPSQQQPPSSGSQNPAGSQNPSSQNPAQPPAGDAGPAANQPITEGCLGGSNPNYTLTDKSGTTYKLNFPAQANVSTLEPHVGESIQVMGDVKSTTIQVSRIGKGRGTCPAKTSK